MIFEQVEESSLSAPVRTGALIETEWLTVQDAVLRCTELGLPRTPKTVRKWAQRSAELPAGSGDVVVQRQDTENGFRYLISRASLDVKIEQEKAFEGQKEPVPTGEHGSTPVGTGEEMFAPVPSLEPGAETNASEHSSSTPVRTGAADQSSSYAAMLERQLERAHQQLDVKDRQIDALLERDRETNVLIQGLQGGLTRVLQALPGGNRDVDRGEQPLH